MKLFLANLVLLASTTLAQVPLINQPLMPPSAKPGSRGFELTVNGTGFSSGAAIEWNGSKQTTEFISRSRLKTTIQASDVAKSGTAWVRVVNPGGVPSSVVFFPIRRQSSSFTFAEQLVFPGCVGVAVGDLNNDGLLDVAWGSSNSLYVSLGDGKGGFRAPILSSGVGTKEMIVADFNGDGNPDLAVNDGSAVLIYLGDGHGNLTFKSQVSAYGGGDYGTAVADFNRDGILDIYDTGWMTIQKWFQIYTGIGDGTFNSEASVPTSSFAGFPAVGDFNGDGWLDLVVSESFANSEVFLGSSGGFGGGVSIPFSTGHPLVADMNHDGSWIF
jgi:VCBS repeat protein